MHCAGYTETTLKYPHYYKYMNNLGFPIFSFDLRGQGFSQYTGPYEDSITHCHSVQETYVEDLLGFLKKYVLPYSNNIIYSASSLSGLVGLALQTQHPGRTPAYAYVHSLYLYTYSLLAYTLLYNILYSSFYILYYLYFVYTFIYPHTLLTIYHTNTYLAYSSYTPLYIYNIGTFKKMILFSPCIKPYFPSYLEYSIIAAHYAGFGLTLATKFDTDITKDKLTHSIQQIAFWSSLRNYFPGNLIVTGPTFQWLYELLVASTYVHQVSV